MIPRTVLIAAGAFEGLSAQRVGSAIARGVGACGLQTDLCPILPAGDLALDARELLDALDFDARMRRSRAVVLAEWRLKEPALAASPAFEVATRARQAGVPSYAVTGRNMLGPFDARVLDLQVILEASSTRALTNAGRRLGKLM
jgi:glycerate 2-kinase